jgi:putative DNA primase/helicase
LPEQNKEKNKMNFQTAHDQAQGRWHDILVSMGIESSRLNGKHGPCPICSGKDRFRFDDKNGKGGWLCSHCGAGDGFSLVAKLKGIDNVAAKMMVVPLLGGMRKRQVSKEIDTNAFRTAAERFWKATSAVSDTGPVGIYLRKRIGVCEAPSAIRQGHTIHPQDKTRSYFVMAAKISGPDGRGISVHKTFISTNGTKANLSPDKLVMPGPLIPSASIWLTDPAEHMGIAEGIETAMSATVLHGIPTWAAISATIMKSFEPPAICKKLTIFADNDANYVGQATAYELARKLVMTRQIEVQVMVPDTIGDWNDVLQRR